MSILRMLADVETSILPGDWGIEDILNLVLNIIIIFGVKKKLIF